MLYFLHHLITHLLDITHSQTNTSNCNDFGSLWFYPSLGFTPLERCDNYCIWCTCKRVICVEIWSIKLISLIIILIFLLFLVCTLIIHMCVHCSMQDQSHPMAWHLRSSHCTNTLLVIQSLFIPQYIPLYIWYCACSHLSEDVNMHSVL